MADQGFNAGSIFVALKANIDDFKSGLREAISQLKGFTTGVGSAVSKIAAIGKQLGNAMLAPVRAVGSLASSLLTLKAAIIGFLASKVFQALVTGPAEAAVELERLAARAGLTTAALEKLQFVVSAAGGRGEDVSIGLEKLNKILQDTKNGSDQFVPVLKELGFLGLDINQIVNKIFSNPNLGAAGLKKLGISELAVLSKLSRDEVDKLLVSFVKLGNGTDAELFKIGNRLQVVKTQLKEAFGNIAEQVTKLVLPHLLDALEAVEKFIEDNMPQILAFFDTVAQQVALFLDAVKKTALVPADLAFALQQSVEAIFEAIGNIAIEGFGAVVKIGIESFKAFGAAIIVLFGPLFTKLWQVAKIELEFLTDKIGIFINGFFDHIFDGFTSVFRVAINAILDVLITAVLNATLALAALPDALVPDGLVEKLTGVTNGLRAARIANTQAIIGETKQTLEQMLELQQQEDAAASVRQQRLQTLAETFQGTTDETTKFALDVFIASMTEIAKQTKQTVKEITGEVLGAMERVGEAFGFKLTGIPAAFEANLAKRQAELLEQLKNQKEAGVLPPVAGAAFNDTGGASGQIDVAALSALEAERAARKKELDQQLAVSEQKIGQVVSGLSDGIRTALNSLFVEGKSTLEALGDVAAKISEQFIGNTIEKLQGALSKGLASAFNDPQVGGAVADLAGALIGIAATIFSIFQSKQSSKKSFSNVADIVNSSQAVRGIVAGPESVAIAAVGQDLQRALAPTNDILRAQLGVLLGIRSAVGGGGAESGFPFAGTTATS